MEPIELPRRGARVAGLIVAAMFAAFTAVWIVVIRTLDWSSVRDVADLAGMLFRLFWAIGWSIGVVVLGLVTVLLLFYRESFHIADGRLVSVPRIGPLRMTSEYDLAAVRNLRLEPANRGMRLRFDYAGRTRGLGDVMPESEAQRILAAIRAAMPATAAGPSAVPAAMPAAPSPEAQAPREGEAPNPPSPAATLALVAANVLPLLGVLAWNWKLADVLVLFWAESAIVAFYTLAKMAVAERWLAIPAGVFFVAHFGAFMAIHFLFLYEIFVRGIGAAGREPGAYEALAQVFVPLWPALAALFLSHGVSFALNFLGRGEHGGATLKALMAAPYQRVVLMQVTLIFGGFIALALRDARPALALLVALKIGADLYAHRRERAAAFSPVSARRRTGAAGTGRSAGT